MFVFKKKILLKIVNVFLIKKVIRVKLIIISVRFRVICSRMGIIEEIFFNCFISCFFFKNDIVFLVILYYNGNYDYF